MQTIPAFYFDEHELDALAKERAEEFRSAEPFAHLTLSDFLPKHVLDLLVSEFPGADDIAWTQWGPGRTRSLPESSLNKLGQSDERCFGPFTRHFMAQLNSSVFVSFLEKLTGLRGIIVDPSYNSCGLHSTGVGGRLMIHTDMNRHPHSGRVLHQILNLILFLNPDWKDEYGGQLELWTRDAEPSVKINPIANRAVLFATGTQSFHGHPEPVACPEGIRRNSIAVYYYSLDRLPSEEYEGMQRTVRWIPTTPADREIARHPASRAEVLLEEVHGTVLRVARGDLPWEVPGAPGPLYLRLVLESRLLEEQRVALAADIAALLPASMGGDAAAFLETHRLFGWIGTAEDTALADRTALLAFLKQDDSSVYIGRRDTQELLFLGYFDEVLGLLAGRLFSHVFALRAKE